MSTVGGRFAGIAVATIVVCALVPTSASAGLARYGNLELAYTQTTNSGGPPPPIRNEHSTYTPCGTSNSLGLLLVSGGARIYDSDPFVTPFELGQAWIVSLFPTGQILPPGPDSYGVVFDTRENTSLVRGDVAVCGDVSGRSFASDDKRSPAKKRTIVKASCPGSKHVLGGGARASGPFLSQRIVASAPYDSKDPGKKPDDGWRAVVDNLGDTRYKVTADAICAPVGGLAYAKDAFKAPKRKRTHAESQCPPGKFVIGGGVSHDGKVRKISLVSTYPDDSTDHDHWFADIDNLARKRASGKVFAICHA